VEIVSTFNIFLLSSITSVFPPRLVILDIENIF